MINPKNQVKRPLIANQHLIGVGGKGCSDELIGPCRNNGVSTAKNTDISLFERRGVQTTELCAKFLFS